MASSKLTSGACSTAFPFSIHCRKLRIEKQYVAFITYIHKLQTRYLHKDHQYKWLGDHCQHVKPCRTNRSGVYLYLKKQIINIIAYKAKIILNSKPWQTTVRPRTIPDGWTLKRLRMLCRVRQAPQFWTPLTWAPATTLDRAHKRCPQCRIRCWSPPGHSRHAPRCGPNIR